MIFTENVDKWTRKIWLNSADVLDYCFGCESQYVGEGAAWWRSLYERFSGHFISLFAQKHFRKYLICLSLWPLAFFYFTPFTISTGIVHLTWVLPVILFSEPVTNVHEMDPDSKSQNSTLCRVLAPSGSRTDWSRWTTLSSILVCLMGSLTDKTKQSIDVT